MKSWKRSLVLGSLTICAQRASALAFMSFGLPPELAATKPARCSISQAVIGSSLTSTTMACVPFAAVPPASDLDVDCAAAGCAGFLAGCALGGDAEHGRHAEAGCQDSGGEGEAAAMCGVRRA